MAQDTKKAEIGRNGSPFCLASFAEILFDSEETKLVISCIIASE